MRTRNFRMLKVEPCNLSVTLLWMRAALCALAMALCAASSHAQLKTRADVGSSTTPGPTCGINSGTMCGVPLAGDIPPLMKPVVADDESCLPWSLTKAADKTSAVTALKVPSKARGEYEKACSSAQKQKFNEAEQHARGAIEKFQDYPAAWVMLGVVLDQQDKMRRPAMRVPAPQK